MTKLKEYLFYKRISITSFAQEVGVNRGYMNLVVLGKCTPSRLLAEEIERKTNGEVKAIDLLEKKNE